MVDDKSGGSSSTSPIVRPPPPRPSSPRPVAPPRKVRWSVEATALLISAWGEQYLAANRGKLKRDQWQQLAAKLSSSDPPRSEKQCKHRLDNIKKTFKVEKAKVDSGGVSRWRFYTQMAGFMGLEVDESREVGVGGSTSSSSNQANNPTAQESQRVEPQVDTRLTLSL